MQAEDFISDDCRQWQVIKQLDQHAPNVRITILAQALIVKAVYLCDLPRFVVAAKDGDAVRVTYLERDKQTYSFNTIVAAVDVVTHEQIVCVW